MNPRTLKSNQELSEYLVRLSGDLHHKGATDLANAAQYAARFATGSASEFLHEAQLALSRVQEQHGGALSAAEASDIQRVLTQIREAFRKVGGA